MILDDFKASAKKFVKVMPIEYKKVLEMRKVDGKLGLTEVADG
jgi:glutamate synthase domain-containing protein 3